MVNTAFRGRSREGEEEKSEEKRGGKGEGRSLP